MCQADGSAFLLIVILTKTNEGNYKIIPGT